MRATLTDEWWEVFEFGRIVAERNDLDQIDIHWKADVPPPIDVVLDVLRGGRLVARGFAAVGIDAGASERPTSHHLHVLALQVSIRLRDSTC